MPSVSAIYPAHVLSRLEMLFVDWNLAMSVRLAIVGKSPQGRPRRPSCHRQRGTPVTLKGRVCEGEATHFGDDRTLDVVYRWLRV